MTREITNKILEAVEAGMLDRDTVIMACLKYMSEDDVADIAHDNEFFDDEETEDESEDSEDEPEYEFTDENEVNEAFADHWEDACNEKPSLRNDKPAKRFAFAMFLDQLCDEGRISAELADDVTLLSEDD